jgi:integrase
MGIPSIRDQAHVALKTVYMDEEAQQAYKAEHQVESIKQAMRRKGKANRTLPHILAKRTLQAYTEICKVFFERAYELSGKKMLRDLFNYDTLILTLDTYYQDMAPATLRTLLSALNMLHQGMRRRRWIKGWSPIGRKLRDHVREYREDGAVRAPRFGYRPEDAPRIIAHMQAKGSVFALPAEILLECGLRRNEVATLRGSDVDVENLKLRVKGKGGRVREVDLPAHLAEQLNTSKPFLFTPSQSWKSAFYQAVRKAARELGIKVSGLHRLRSNYAQEKYRKLRAAGKTKRQAKQQVSRDLGHNRIDVLKSYIDADE